MRSEAAPPGASRWAPPTSLETLAVDDERAAAVARLRFLAGLSVEETAQALDISVRSVRREWTYARARLFAMLGS